MTRKQLLRFLVIALSLSGCAWAQTAGIIAPSRGIDWSQAGIPGGIPNRTSICATLSPGTTSSQINSAIANCPAGQVVYLNAGTYNLSGAINISRSDVTLRGAGPDQTKLVFASGGGCGNTSADICVTGSGQWSGGPNNQTTWTAGYAKGTTVITLGSVANLSVGQVLILDQLNDSADTGNIYVCGTTACSSEGAAGGGGRGDVRSQLQFAEVKAISGNNVTISPGLHMPNWRASQSPGAWWANKLATNVGIEDLSIRNSGGAGSNTVLVNAYKSWMKNVASIGGGSRSHVDLQYSANIVVRDSYFWGASGANLSYGVETWMAGNNLIENNIFHHVTSPMLVGANLGTVWAYNYAIDQYSINTGWLYPSAMEHDPGTSMNLFEGNEVATMMEDSIHGTHAMNTFFRNRLAGLDSAGKQNNQTVPFLFQVYSRYANLIGNVLGTPGYHNTYQTNPGVGSTGACNTSIYNLGWGSTNCSTGSLGTDSRVISTMMRWGNYDTATNSVKWDASEVPSGLSLYANPVPSTQALPASLYLASKPSWWPANAPWPAIGPDVTGGSGPGGRSYPIPARLCYTSTPTDSSGIKVFNASKCYGTAQSGSTKPAPPSGLTAVAN